MGDGCSLRCARFARSTDRARPIPASGLGVHLEREKKDIASASLIDWMARSLNVRMAFRPDRFNRSTGNPRESESSSKNSSCESAFQDAGMLGCRKYLTRRLFNLLNAASSSNKSGSRLYPI